VGGTRPVTGADGRAREGPLRDGRTAVRALAGELVEFGRASVPAVWGCSAGNPGDPSWAMTSSLSMLKWLAIVSSTEIEHAQRLI
jgi:hypothetical protein